MSTYKVETDPDGVKTTFTPNQLNKFRLLSKKIIVANGAAYLPIDELHGVLLTNSRKIAIKIVNNHDYLIKNYLVRDKLKFPNCPFSIAIKPMGICLLLDRLANENPRRAAEYRESSYILGYIIASNPELKVQSQEIAKKQAVDMQALIHKLKKVHSVCQLSGKPFQLGEQKHAHHIESKACRPELMAEESNLIIISKEAHDSYHAWLFSNSTDIDRLSLIKYAQSEGYSTDYSHDLN
jgi:hypothetical protein